MVAKLLVGFVVAPAMVPAIAEPTGPALQAVEISQRAATSPICGAMAVDASLQPT